MAKELFTANEILQRCLLYIRNQCESASSSLTGKGSGDKAISLIRIDPHMTITLDGFCHLQAEQCDAAYLQLSRMRNKIMKLAWECCAVSSVEIFLSFNLIYPAFSSFCAFFC